MARGQTTSTLTAQKDNIKATETIGVRAGGPICPGLIASSPRRRQRLLSPNPDVIPAEAGIHGGAGLPSAGGAGSGFPKIDRSRNSMGVAQYEPYDSARVVEGRTVIRGRVRCRSRFVARERRRRELESKPVIDTAALTNGEGHVVRYGNVRRVRKVIVGCPATRPLRGQSPVCIYRESAHRPQSVGNRLVPNPTKPLPKTLGRGATPRTEKPERDEKAPKGPIKRVKQNSIPTVRPTAQPQPADLNTPSPLNLPNSTATPPPSGPAK